MGFMDMGTINITSTILFVASVRLYLRKEAALLEHITWYSNLWCKEKNNDFCLHDSLTVASSHISVSYVNLSQNAESLALLSYKLFVWLRMVPPKGLQDPSPLLWALTLNAHTCVARRIVQDVSKQTGQCLSKLLTLHIPINPTHYKVPF